ncbi:hypothetical protein SEVIR_8G234300v4 [Setaria viridis]|uniref:Knottin scorpion toxin-like domain-containing protein n=1 Tax=Setaria viridis TaxID=4556 RepID=A0A4U6TLY9_SETVI|nr:hypothetical protein SEVIR_8G234300v2 [Setaria viridis]
MARIVHYVMATSFVVLVMISSNSPSCQACLFRTCRWPKCFNVTENNCNFYHCKFVCRHEGYKTSFAYCKERPKNTKKPYMCCCPPDPI